MLVHLAIGAGAADMSLAAQVIGLGRATLCADVRPRLAMGLEFALARWMLR